MPAYVQITFFFSVLLEGNSRRERLDKNKKTDTLERLKEERKRKDAKRQKGNVLDNFYGSGISIADAVPFIEHFERRRKKSHGRGRCFLIR